MAGEALVEQAAERVDIGARIHRLLPPLLRRHVRRRAVPLAGLGERQAALGGLAEQLGDAEVGDLHGPLRAGDGRRVGPGRLLQGLARQEQVARLEIAVHDATRGAMHRAHRRRGLLTDRDGLRRRQRADVREVTLERRAVDQLHRDVVGAVGAAVIVRAHHAGVLHPRRDLGLVEEAHPRLAARRQVAVQDLHRDAGVVLQPHRLVDRAEAALAQRLQQPVAGDGRRRVAVDGDRPLQQAAHPLEQGPQRQPRGRIAIDRGLQRRRQHPQRLGQRRGVDRPDAGQLQGRRRAAGDRGPQEQRRAIGQAALGIDRAAVALLGRHPLDRRRQPGRPQGQHPAPGAQPQVGVGLEHQLRAVAVDHVEDLDRQGAGDPDVDPRHLGDREALVRPGAAQERADRLAVGVLEDLEALAATGRADPQRADQIGVRALEARVGPVRRQRRRRRSIAQRADQRGAAVVGATAVEQHRRRHRQLGGEVDAADADQLDQPRQELRAQALVDRERAQERPARADHRAVVELVDRQVEPRQRVRRLGGQHRSIGRDPLAAIRHRLHVVQRGPCHTKIYHAPLAARPARRYGVGFLTGRRSSMSRGGIASIGAGMRASKSIQIRLSVRQLYVRQVPGRCSYTPQKRVVGSLWTQ